MTAVFNLFKCLPFQEKFSDVVAWLRAKSSKAEGDSIASLADNQKLVDGAESSIFKSRPEMNILSTPVVSVSSTPNLFSSIQTSDNQKPLFPGSNLSLTPLMSGMPDGNFLSRVHQVETCRYFSCKIHCMLIFSKDEQRFYQSYLKINIEEQVNIYSSGLQIIL